MPSRESRQREEENLVFAAIKANPQIELVRLQEITGLGRHKIKESIKRLISKNKITDREFTDLEEIKTDVPYGVVLIRKTETAAANNKIRAILDNHSDLGSWKYITVGKIDYDFALFLRIPNTDPRIAGLYDKLLAEVDGSDVETIWVNG